ncbi:type II secretion system protein F (GspF) [Ectothiorhodosinus mongolicus]|uniref:Type II secretion system protein F (GspF) n=1 Tax=Ectothiorhodosinus mongolicus TaxID=233100 RepID=A0A1R3VSS4_9GAMM|nr:type II secretion system F family protein [Ectothiorhodosinus mongolicus]ULX56668.1 hypothetical protein CKX93_02455 [Ectothiorhodosinus mongolicus]SIT66732.1 type II secretion system protein F (GspF) [Ectothiorhodosinus mongolicus]
MHVFHWQGINRRGQACRGKDFAPDIAQLRAHLAQQGVTLLKAKPRRWTLSYKKPGCKHQPLQQVLDDCADLLTAGIPLTETLALMVQNPEHKTLRNMLITLRDRVMAGQSLAQAMAAEPQCFKPLAVHWVQAGEQSGTLSKVLKRLARHLQRRVEARARLQKALQYPVLVVALGIIVSIVMLIFVVPQFELLFQDFGADLPTLTVKLLALSEALQTHGPRLALAIISLVMLSVGIYRRYARLRYHLHRAMLRTPLIGRFLAYQATTQFAHTLTSLLQAGMPLTAALMLMTPGMNNLVFQETLRQTAADITQGHSFAACLRNSRHFPQHAISLISLGEQTGTLGIMLERLATLIDQRQASQTERLSQLIEPVSMLLLGALVGTMVVALYLPIIQLGTVL